jgi:hypothetical protein
MLAGDSCHTCDISKVEASCHQNPDRAQLSLRTSENSVTATFGLPSRERSIIVMAVTLKRASPEEVC